MPRIVTIELPAGVDLASEKTVADTLNQFLTREQFKQMLGWRDDVAVQRELERAKLLKAAFLVGGHEWRVHLGLYVQAKAGEKLPRRKRRRIETLPKNARGQFTKKSQPETTTTE